jgi:hypothetical protein
MTQLSFGERPFPAEATCAGKVPMNTSPHGRNKEKSFFLEREMQMQPKLKTGLLPIYDKGTLLGCAPPGPRWMKSGMAYCSSTYVRVYKQ